MHARLRPVLLFILLSGLVTAGCGGPTVDLKQGLQLQIVSSGWFDAGIVEGKNKLVPSVVVTLKNVSGQNLVSLQVFAIFHRVNDPQEWGTGFITAAGSGGLQPGSTTMPLTLKSHLGYTGTEPRAEMLNNSKFVDAKVDIMVKYASTQWTKVGESPISRQLLTQ
jgi:hypothetical protein